MTIVCHRSINNLLNAVNVGREASNNDSALRTVNHTFQHWTDFTLERGKAGNVRIGGVGQEQVDAFFTEACECTQIGEATVERKLVHLEVTGVKDKACFRTNRDSQSIRNGVVDGYKLELIRSELLLIALFHLQGVGLDAVLFELGFDESKGQARAHQRNVILQPKKIGNSTNVVFVTMGEHDGKHVIHAVTDVAEVRKDEVHTRLGLFREEHTTVHNKQLAVEFVDGHVAANLPHSSEWDNAQRSVF